MKDKKFDLFGSKIVIKETDRVLVKDKDIEAYGGYNPDGNEILLAETVNGHTVTEDEKRITLLHELFHCIFDKGKYNADGDDEPLVEWCARCINSLIKQKII